MMKKALSITMLLLLAWCAMAQSKGDTLYVAAHSGLNLRTEPGTKAIKITAIPKGGQVTILADVDSSQAYAVTEFPGFQIKGFWVEVDYKGQVGYVFSGYLSGFKPFRTVKNGGVTWNESEYNYFKHYFSGPDFIDYYIPDTCITDWEAHFEQGITYELAGACMDGGAVLTIKFSNYSLQDVYLFYLTMMAFPNKPHWNKEEKRIEAFDTGSPNQTDGVAGCMDFMWKIGTMVFLERNCSC